MNSGNEKQPADKLEALLEKQITLARKSELLELERLASECESLVEKISADGTFEQPGSKEQRDRIEKLYREFSLIVASRKGAAEDELKRIRKGKRIIGKYRRNLAPM